jgi:hypothetical protein
MSSLKDSIALLESDLIAEPPRINVYHDLPFAIMRYDPTDEWELRWEIKLLTTRLESCGKEVHVIPMSELRKCTAKAVLTWWRSAGGVRWRQRRFRRR